MAVILNSIKVQSLQVETAAGPNVNLPPNLYRRRIRTGKADGKRIQPQLKT